MMGAKHDKKNTENKYNSDCHRSKGIYFRGVVVMVVKKQEIQDSGGGVWQKFALSKLSALGARNLKPPKETTDLHLHQLN